MNRHDILHSVAFDIIQQPLGEHCVGGTKWPVMYKGSVFKENESVHY